MKSIKVVATNCPGSLANKSLKRQKHIIHIVKYIIISLKYENSIYDKYYGRVYLTRVHLIRVYVHRVLMAVSKWH